MLAPLLLGAALSDARACAPAPTPAPALVRGDVISDILIDVHEALHARKFAQLDDWAASYARPGQPKLSVSKISAFYDAIDVGYYCGQKLDQAELNAHRQLFIDWAKVSSAPAVPVIAHAKLETAVAWEARGGGFAHTVTPEGWTKFRAGQARAEALLRSVEAGGRAHAAWFSEMLTLGTEQGWNLAQYDAIFNAAVAAFPDRYGFYDDKSRYLDARWHGSDEMLKDFVEQAVKAKGGDDGKFLYARLYLSRSAPDLFTSGRADWPRMKEGLEVVIKRFPEKVNRMAYARFACLANDWEAFDIQAAIVADRMMGKLDGTLMYDYYKCLRKRERDLWDADMKRRRADHTGK